MILGLKVLKGYAKDLNFTVHLSTQVYNCLSENLTKCWEVTCYGLVSHPGGVENELPRGQPFAVPINKDSD